MRRRLLLTAAALAPFASGCTNEKALAWEEEVVLSTGERLLLARTTRYRKSGEPFNPMEVGWAPEDSTIKILEGPQALVGAAYATGDWIEPLLLDRDLRSQELVLVGTAWNCDWVKKYQGKNRSVYMAFALAPGREAQPLEFPDWAWNQKRNLYLSHLDHPPPKRVTPELAREHNATKARGHKIFFVIDPSFRTPDC